MDEQSFQLIVDDIKEIKKDVRILLESHYKKLGIQIATSFIFSLVFAIIIALIEKH